MSSIFIPVAGLANTGGLTFSIGAVSEERSSTAEVPVRVPINVSNNDGFAAVGLVISYEADKLRFVSVTPSFTSLPVQPVTVSTERDDGGLIRQWVLFADILDMRTGFTQDGKIADINFVILPNAATGPSPIGLSFTPAPREGVPVATNASPINAEARGANLTITAADGSGGGGGTTPPPDFDPDNPRYFLRVIGAGAGRQPEADLFLEQGARVDLNAGTAPTGQTFVNWTRTPTTASLTNANNATTARITMPSARPTAATYLITVTANWSGGGDGSGNPPPPGAEEFQLRVVGAGTGGTQTANHPAGATVQLNAGTDSQGRTFNNWTRAPANGGNLTNPTSATGAAITLPTNINAIADRIVTVTANWNADGNNNNNGGTGGDGGNGGNGGSGNNQGGNNNQSGTNAHPVLSHFGTWAGTGTSSARVSADHSRFIRLTRGGTEIASTHYTITSGSTVITLNESYIMTLADGTYVFRAEFSDGHADLNLIVSRGFGNVPQTGVADITLQVVAMWVSVFLAAGLCVCLFFYRREMRKRTDVRSFYGKQK